ncbi:DUF2771 domain-containing protein [Streptomyces sp. NPDC006610]|jgi:hypothetical protein|uniref:DUF2771 domain-containing protein n=1 Tax=Streptomyces sp. NPDC006610 TaxID=3154584 RepID=UPI0033B250D4
MTTLQSAVRRRRAVAAAGAVTAGLLVLSACDKPTPVATITVGSDSVSSEATCHGDGKAIKDPNKCLQEKDIESLSIDPDGRVRFGVDWDVAEKGWLVMMNGNPMMAEPTKKSYLSTSASSFFNPQNPEDSALITIVEGTAQEPTAMWSFRLKKDA